MENSNIIKQAKSDIFKELFPIISFYIKKGAQPKALKKYYKTKRFYDILEDIKNKGINLIKDEKEYHKLVREILNEILDDFITKEKDDNYKKNMYKKMKNLKTFEGFFKDMMKPYIHPDFHEDIYGRSGEHEVEIISKRKKEKRFGDDKFLIGIRFNDGFEEEIEVSYPTYSRLRIGEKTIFNL